MIPHARGQLALPLPAIVRSGTILAGAPPPDTRAGHRLTQQKVRHLRERYTLSSYTATVGTPSFVSTA